jgi:hypothetical protein
MLLFTAYGQWNFLQFTQCWQLMLLEILENYLSHTKKFIVKRSVFLVSMFMRALKYNTVLLCMFIVIQLCILHFTVPILSSEKVDSYFKLLWKFFCFVCVCVGGGGCVSDFGPLYNRSVQDCVAALWRTVVLC